jgi:hypothetical protein
MSAQRSSSRFSSKTVQKLVLKLFPAVRQSGRPTVSASHTGQPAGKNHSGAVTHILQGIRKILLYYDFPVFYFMEDFICVGVFLYVTIMNTQKLHHMNT